MLKTIMRLLAGFAICLVAQTADAQQIFVRNMEGALASRPVPGAGSWTALDGDLGGGVDACTDGSGNTYVVTRGKEGFLWMKRRIGGAWQGWQSLGGNITSDPAVACAPDGVGVFARGTNGGLMFKMYDPANLTGPYTPLGGTLVGGPDATSSAAGRFDVVVHGTDHQMVYTRISGGRSEGWRHLGGQFTSDPAILAVERNGRFYLEVFGRGTDNGLWHGAVEPDGPTGWQPLGGTLGGAPDAMSSGPQRMEVAARWADGSTRTIMFRGGWQAWESAGGQTTADVAITGGAAPDKSPTPPDRREAAARFRVTVGGFRVTRETYDDVIERDGSRDEVFFIPTVFGVTRSGAPSTARTIITSSAPVIGQRRNDTVVQAGSATATGGLWVGDNFPARPWLETLPGPLGTLFEGVLRQGEDAVVIVPTLWEWDGNDNNAAQYSQEVQRRRANVARIVSEMIPNPRVTTDRSTFVFPGHNVGLSQPFSWDGRPGNRPIGVARVGDSTVAFTPRVFVLTYEAAQLIAGTDFPETPRLPARVFGGPPISTPMPGPAPGVFTIEYEEGDDFQGHYIIYIRVERCASLDSCG